MVDRIPMSRAGYDKIREEIQRLENEEMPKIVERLAAARAEGDLKENAEYHGARESQGMLQAKINLLRDKLARAEIIDPATVPRDCVSFGSTVRVRDLDLDDEEEFTLVGAGEEDYDNGRILASSPIGDALLGKRIGDKVDVPVPRGKLVYEIVDIRFEE